MKKIAFTSLPTFLVSTLLLSNTGQAQAADPEAIVTRRQEVMADLKDAMKQLKHVTSNDDIHDAVAPATKIQELTQDLTALFPAGSTTDDSAAKAEIWSNWTDFAQLANNAKTQAETLTKAANSGDLAAVQTAVQEMGSTCKSCHKDFRGEK